MTTTYAALLGAVNVGGRRVPMAELRDVLRGLGHTDVRTYLASGNAVFAGGGDGDDGGDGGGGGGRDDGALDAIAATIEAALKDRFGFEVPCLVRTGGYLRAVLDACPFPADELAGKQLHAIFYSAPVAADRFAGIDRQAFLPEEFALGDRVLYLHAPGGVGRSPLSAALSKCAGRLKDIRGTGRNWNTVKALAEMTAHTGSTAAAHEK
jgi:uncharacterized protein (DUF1697 family)